ncbi:CHAT domain-containing protein [Mycena pura]|uniref:CHAT domain-containing protein n=1 Tax=Mycena pura TaxID=153505 RepID=A0AAD6URG0_9AGAR|nr:CHAT domain-containing protein [Mycena pura]
MILSSGYGTPPMKALGATPPDMYVALHAFNVADTDTAGSIQRWGSKIKNPERSGIDGPMPLQHLAAMLVRRGHLTYIRSTSWPSSFSTFPLTIMSELKTVIKLHSIRITSLTNPHDDLPGDMRMFAQLIIQGNIFLQTLPVALEADQISWKLGFGCHMIHRLSLLLSPPHAPTFSVAVLRQSETEGTRLIGYVEIGRGEALGTVESSKPFQLQLNKVNPNGPSLNFRAGLSVSKLLNKEVSGLDLIYMVEDAIASVNGRGIASELQKMDKDSKKTEFSMDALHLRVMHERILLCYQSNDNRAQLLNILGDIILRSYKGSGTVDDFNQAVCAYNDAVRDDPGSVIFLGDLGTSLLRCFKQFGSVRDINQSVKILKDAVQLTPHGHPDKPSLLNNLGNSLLGRFERLGDLNDINKSVLMFEDAVKLTPDGHPDKPSRLNNLGNSLFRRFERLGDLSDINKAVLMFEDAVKLTPDGHPDKPSLLNNLGNSLLGRFERLGDLSDINKSVLMFGNAVKLTPDGHPDKPSLLNNLGNSLLGRFERLGDLNDINKSVLMFEDAVKLTPDGHPDKPSRLNNLGNSLFRHFERLGDLSDINKAVLMFEDAVKLTPDGHPDKPSLLNNLGNSLLGRFERLGDLSDINKSVLMFENAVKLTPDGHSRLNNLGNSLFRRFERLGDLSDINKAVSMKEDAVKLTPDGHPDKPRWLNNLGTSLLGRFERLGDLSDLNKSVLMKEDAVKLTPDGHPDKPFLLNNLGNSLLGRFERLGDLSDINKSVLMFEDAVKLTPDGHPDKPSLLNNIGNSLFHRFERLGDLSDINKSVLMFEDAVKLTPDGHPDKPSLLNNLGNSLLGRFERLGDLSDINKSVLMKEDAVKLTPDGHPDKPSRLNNLGNSLFRRFKRLGDLSDINKAVSMKEDAVKLTPDGHPDKPGWLNNLGTSLLGRFERLGDLSDLNKSVLIKEDAVKLIPDGHPDKPSLLNNLGHSLFRRFERLGDLSDINKSVLMFEDAVKLTPDGHPDKPSLLNNLGHSLFRRFERLGDLSDINKSVLMKEDAVKLTPDGHPDKPSRLSSLGNSLFRRFERLGDLRDINKSVLMFDDAVMLTPDGHPAKPSRLNNLGNSLLGRFEQLGDVSDINKSVLMKEDAVKLTPDGHPDKPSRLSNLGNLLLGRFEHLHDPKDARQLILHYTSAACSITGPASIRFNAAKQWAKHAHIHQPSSLLHAYTIAIELLPELAWLGLSITDRHHHLSEAGEVVRDAASAAIALHDYQKAVEWLDQGRSIIWGQLLNLRTPVDDLSKSHPALADQLVSLSTSLDTAGTRSDVVADGIEPQSLQSIANQAHDLALKRDHVLQQIRVLPGFERFLLPKPISELSMAAKKGPVAILNTSAYGCDALILLPGLVDDVICVPLSDLTIQEAQAMARLLASIVGTSGRNESPQCTCNYSKTPVGQNLQRIWWCPTGPLVFLPIHAAGFYGEDQAFGSKLSDVLISSYTPSLTALIEGFRPHSELQADLQLLAVSQPSAQGQCDILGTQQEIIYIQEHAKGKVTVLPLNQDMATIGNVQKGMKDSRWVHFACHGVQSTSPTESSLLLAGSSRLTVADIIQLNLPDADLAFLSACQTATGSTKLQDEAVHLTAGMLLSGYRGVIGTMWSIGDNVAPQVAGDVYAHLFKASSPDPTRAAEALHLAVQRLQEQLGAKKSFIHWTQTSMPQSTRKTHNTKDYTGTLTPAVPRGEHRRGHLDAGPRGCAGCAGRRGGGGHGARRSVTRRAHGAAFLRDAAATCLERDVAGGSESRRSRAGIEIVTSTQGVDELGKETSSYPEFCLENNGSSAYFPSPAAINSLLDFNKTMAFVEIFSLLKLYIQAVYSLPSATCIKQQDLKCIVATFCRHPHRSPGRSIDHTIDEVFGNEMVVC